MRTRAAVVILLLAMFVLPSITVIRIIPVEASGTGSSTLSLSDAELSTQFAYENGPATLAAVTDVPGTGVQFNFTGLDPALSTIVGNNFPVNSLAGGVYKDYGYGFAGPYDFSGYKQYSLCIKNIGPNSITVNTKMNTGWTVDWSGGLWKGPDGFGASLARDTFWENGWISIAPGECKIVTLDFSNATCYNAKDDPVTAWQHPDNTSGVPVQRLDEVSDIGFQVLGNGPGSIIVKGTQLYIDPPVVNKTPGDVGTSFPVAVTLENFANLAGFDIKLTWNSTLITETSVDYNTTLNALWGAGNWAPVFEQSGPGFYELAVVALATSASNTGASVLFTKTFHVDTSGTFPLQTPIHFDLVGLSDNSVPVPKSICTIVTDGMYYMSGPSVILVHNVAITQISPSKTTATIGDIIDVNVTAANLGNYTESFNVTLYYNATQIDKLAVNNLGQGLQQLLTFHWNTTGLTDGKYNLTATADIVPGETIISDNTKSYAQLITLMPPITLLMKVEPSAYTAKFVNQTFAINITLYNITENLNLVGFQFRLSYNSTLLEIVQVTNGTFLENFAGAPNGGMLYYGPFIGTGQVLFGGLILPDVNGTWHGPFPSGNGTVATIVFKVIYQPIGLQNPVAYCNLTLFNTILGDNQGNSIPNSVQNGVFGVVPNPLGDLNYDGKVDILDAIVLANAFGTHPSDHNWNPDADLNHDGVINILDAIILSNHFGEVRPDP